jgi:hypothetical protein
MQSSPWSPVIAEVVITGASLVIAAAVIPGIPNIAAIVPAAPSRQARDGLEEVGLQPSLGRTEPASRYAGKQAYLRLYNPP